MQHAGDRFSDTDYADDIDAIGSDLPQLAGTLASIEGACCELGLHIPWVKTNIQNNGTGPLTQNITVCGQQVEGVDWFRYLGSPLSSAISSRSSSSVE